MAVFDAWALADRAGDVLAARHATPQGVAERQQARLAALLTHAQTHSPLLRERLAGVVPGRTPLHALPVMRRADLMAHFDDWVTDPALRLAGLREFVADPARVAEPYLGRYVVWESSGTGGAPGVYVQDAGALAVYDALESLRRPHGMPGLEAWRWLDPIGVGQRFALVVATGGHYASVVSLERLRRLNPWLAHTMRAFSVLQPVASLVSELNAWQPTAIAAYPTAVALLADEARAGTLHIRPRELWTGGETLTDAVRAHVSAQFGVAVRNSYGASECLAIGAECAHGAMHLNADWVILEPVDERGRPVPPGVASASVLLTNLANRVQPLIRYDLGDSVVLHEGRCGCGSPLPTMTVHGRRDDVLALDAAHPRRRPVSLLPLALTTLLEEEAGLMDFQLRQCDGHTLELCVGGDDAEACNALRRAGDALRRYAQQQGAAPLSVLECPGRTLPRGRSGKLKRIVARTDVVAA